MKESQPTFFDHDAPAPKAGRALVLRAQPRRPLTKAQRTFNRLVARIEDLRTKVERTTRQLDEALVFNAQHIQPRLQRAAALRKDFVRALQPFLNDPRIARRDKKTLHAILVEHLSELIGLNDPADADLRALFEELHGADYDQVAGQQMDELRSEIESVFGEIGLDLDLSGLHPNMTDEEMAAKMAEMSESARRQTERMRSEGARERPPTKRELEETARLRQLDDLRRANAGTIYRELAKVLHPDLERDPDARERKSALMQELTAAHARNDLLTLLRLQLEWNHRDETDAAHLTDDRLNAYNRLLGEQAADLQEELNGLPWHPKYHPIALIDGPFSMGVQLDGPSEARRLDAVIAGLEAGLVRVRGDQGWREARDLVLARRAEDALGDIRMSLAAGPTRRRKHRRLRR